MEAIQFTEDMPRSSEKVLNTRKKEIFQICFKKWKRRVDLFSQKETILRRDNVTARMYENDKTSYCLKLIIIFLDKKILNDYQFRFLNIRLSVLVIKYKRKQVLEHKGIFINLEKDFVTVKHHILPKNQINVQ